MKTSKKIIFFSTPAYGHTLCVLPVIKRLVEKGYIVECYSTIEFKEMFEKIGAKFIEYEIDFEIRKLDKITSNMFELMKALININRHAYELYEMYIKNNKPDLIIYDSMCSFAKNICKKYEIKSVCFVTTIGFNLPVVLTSNIGRSSVAIFLKNISEVKEILKQEMCFRRENKLKKINLIDLFINKADETIVFTPKEFQPLSWTFPKKVHFIGTTIKDKGCIKEENDNEKQHYEYYISFGTIFDENKKYLQKLIDYLDGKDSKTIISAGNTPDLINTNENIIIETKVNQVKLLPNCDFFINHAGTNSVLESIYYEVPQICIPQQEEQKYVAKIVQRKKLGIYMKKYNENDLEKIKIFKNSNKIKEMSKILKKYDGTSLAVNIICEYIEKRKNI